MAIGVSKVTTKGQVTIPEDIRRDTGIKSGTQLVFFEVDGDILVKKSEDIDRLFDVFTQKAKKLGLTRKKLANEVELEKKRTLKKYFR